LRYAAEGGSNQVVKQLAQVSHPANISVGPNQYGSRSRDRADYPKLPGTDVFSVDQPNPIGPWRDVEAARSTEVEEHRTITRGGRSAVTTSTSGMRRPSNEFPRQGRIAADQVGTAERVRLLPRGAARPARLSVRVAYDLLDAVPHALLKLIAHANGS
jgi:hypothetical protein